MSIVTSLDAINSTLQQILNQMAINQQQFDQDLAPLIQAVTAIGTDINNLATAITNWQNSHQGVDLTTEDQQVIAAAQALTQSKATVDTEIQNLTPPPPGP